MSTKLIRFDWAMKRLLRDKANFDILEGFLCALFEDDNVKIISILESESNQKINIHLNINVKSLKKLNHQNYFKLSRTIQKL